MRNLFVLLLNIILFLFLIFQVNHYNNSKLLSNIFHSEERNISQSEVNVKSDNIADDSSANENSNGFKTGESSAENNDIQNDDIYINNSDLATDSFDDKKSDVSSNTTNLSDLELNRKFINEHIGENYLDAVLARGLLTRWNPRSFPLVVYISSEIPQNFSHEIRNAFDRWQYVTDNYIRFNYSGYSEKADIKCVLNDKSGNRKFGEHSCEAASAVIETINDNKLSGVTINVYTKDCNGKLWNNNAFYSSVLHEIGHALGLAGHSSNVKDVMYPYMKGFTHRDDISKADITTLRAVYSIIPDVTNVPFSEVEKQGLISSKDYWGEKKYRDRYQQSGERIINEKVVAFNSLIAAARTHENNREYTKAIYNYEKALSYADNDDLQYKIKRIIVQDYLRINQLDNAEKLLKEISVNKKDNNIAILYNNIATKYLKTNNYKKSEDLLNTGLRFATEKETIKILYNNLCYVAAKLKKYEMYKKYEKILKSL